MTRGSLPFDERIDPRRLADQLADALQRVDARDVIATVDRVSFRGGIFRSVSNWNVLVPFSHGELIINGAARRLEYKLSFRQLVWILVVGSVFFLIFMLVTRFPPFMIPVVLAMVWLWLGWLNVLIGRARFESLLRKTIDATGRVSRFPVS